MTPADIERLLSRASAAIVHARNFEARGDIAATELCCKAARELLDRAQRTLGERLDQNPGAEPFV